MSSPTLATTPEPAEYYAVIFTSLRSDVEEGYSAMADRMLQLAGQQPGFLGAESVRDACGLGITVSYWTDKKAIAAWRAHSEHQLAQKAGRRVWYRDYCLRVARVERAYRKATPGQSRPRLTAAPGRSPKASQRQAQGPLDTYLGRFPDTVRRVLERIRSTVRRAAPDAQECISYGMPCFRLKKNLVYFAAFKDHVSFFPTASGIRRFQRELSRYKVSKGTVRFPHGSSIPYGLIARIVRFRVREALATSAPRQGRRTIRS